jgi:hypothetical protein
MERLIHESRETLSALTIVACLAAGIGGAVFYTLGPDGWLVGMVRTLLREPNLATLIALLAVIGAISLAKRVFDGNANSTLNNLLVGAVGLGGFVLLLQGARAIF